MGNAWPANSWVQAFTQDSSRGPFTSVTAEMLSGGEFEVPGFRSFSAAGWTVGAGTPVPLHAILG